MKRIDLTGKQYGRLKVLSFSKNDGKSTFWNCICECGKEHIVRSDVLRKGISKSCGCLHNELLIGRITTHGLKKRNKRLYGIWQGIKRRCLNKKYHTYKDYGGRGITICPEWKDDFQSFFNWALSNGYADNLTIDRIDNNGNYEPSNCRWTTMFFQNRNKSNNNFVTMNGETKTLTDWANELGICRRTLSRRLAVEYKPDNLAEKALEEV